MRIQELVQVGQEAWEGQVILEALEKMVQDPSILGQSWSKMWKSEGAAKQSGVWPVQVMP